MVLDPSPCSVALMKFEGRPAIVRSMRRLDRALLTQLVTFGVIGVGSTIAYAILYLLLRTGSHAQVANAIALFVTAIGNTLVNRRFTFGVRERRGVAGDLIAGFVALGLALLITSASVAILGVVAPSAGRIVEIVVLTAANVVATLMRFIVLRTWIGRRATAGPPRELVTSRVTTDG
jgi:putative flippase GtrA